MKLMVLLNNVESLQGTELFLQCDAHQQITEQDSEFGIFYYIHRYMKSLHSLSLVILWPCITLCYLWHFDPSYTWILVALWPGNAWTTKKLWLSWHFYPFKELYNSMIVKTGEKLMTKCEIRFHFIHFLTYN